MKQITNTYTVYSFDELSEKAKENAISNLYYINVEGEWWESVYEDAEQIGLKIEGFDIDRGSYVQARFIGNAYDAANEIIKNHGDQCETYKTAKQFISEYNALVEKYSDGKNINVVAEENVYDFDGEADDLEIEFLKSLCEDYRIMLSNEYDYLTSKEAIIETIEANEYTFLENGTMKNF